MDDEMKGELTWAEFRQRLIKAGWTEEEADAEIERIKNEPDESGYDGP